VKKIAKYLLFIIILISLSLIGCHILISEHMDLETDNKGNSSSSAAALFTNYDSKLMFNYYPVRCMHVDETNGYIYAGTSNQGLWRQDTDLSDDAERISLLGSWNVTSVYANGNIIYAGLNDSTDSFPSAFYYNDGGTIDSIIWTANTALDNMTVSGIFVVGTNLYVTTSFGTYGLWKSIDGGATFLFINLGTSSAITGISGNSNYIYTWNNDYVFRVSISTNAVNSYGVINEIVSVYCSGSNIYIISNDGFQYSNDDMATPLIEKSPPEKLAVICGSGGKIYGHGESGSFGFYYSDDNGDTWSAQYYGAYRFNLMQETPGALYLTHTDYYFFKVW